jgi:hypothetical protein
MRSVTILAYPRSKPAALTEAFVAVATDVTRHRLSLVPGSETLI